MVSHDHHHHSHDHDHHHHHYHGFRGGGGNAAGGSWVGVDGRVWHSHDGLAPHSHEPIHSPGNFTKRAPLLASCTFTDRAFTFGIGGPVGTGDDGGNAAGGSWVGEDGRVWHSHDGLALHSHEPIYSPGDFTKRAPPLTSCALTDRAFTIGIGSPIGAGDGGGNAAGESWVGEDSRVWHSHDSLVPHSHEPIYSPGDFTKRALPLASRAFTDRAFTVGIGSPFGTG